MLLVAVSTSKAKLWFDPLSFDRRPRGLDKMVAEPEAVAPLTPLAGDFTVKKPALKFPLG